MVITNNSMRVATGVLNEIVTEAVAMQQPPSDKGKRLRIYYTTQVAVKPPTFVIFVNDKELMHFSYTRYLENRIRETFGFRNGTEIHYSGEKGRVMIGEQGVIGYWESGICLDCSRRGISTEKPGD